jgi:hypothetical protein
VAKENICSHTDLHPVMKRKQESRIGVPINVLNARCLYMCHAHYKGSIDTSTLYNTYLPIIVMLSTIGIECEVLLDPDFGSVLLTGLAVWSEAQYSCKDGFSLLGDQTRTCTETGNWTGVQPLCITSMYDTKGSICSITAIKFVASEVLSPLAEVVGGAYRRAITSV